MATAPRIAITPVKTLTGLSVPQESFQEAATQTFSKGALVRLASGYLTECGTDPVLIMGVASRDGQNGAAAGDKSQAVYLAHPDTLFKGNLDTSGSEGNGTTAVTDRGKNYGVAKASSGGTWYVDKTDQTNKRVVVWDFWTAVQDGVNMAVGDTLGWILFQFDPQYFQGSHTS